ncbi:MAG: stage II sporulation protein D [Ruminococcaceae bacterium]|nr:stage II sporulation protein D [Oscillospiraceae bacterium]
MKKTVFLAVILLICLSAVPLLADYFSDMGASDNATASDVKEVTSVQTQESTDTLSAQTAAAEENEEEILVCFASSGAVVGVPLEEYVIGVVAGEMPALYEPEALRAQAAASLNLARLALLDGTSERLGGGHISSSPASAQAYLTEEQMRDKWGDDFDMYYARIAEAVQAVFDYEIVYDDNLCQTCFHAVSAGRTENSENVWQNAVPYLTAVDSRFDATADNYSVSVQLHADTFAEGLEPYGFVPQQTARLWLGESTYSDSGTLLSLEVGNITVSGAQLRSAFGLRSAAVDVIYEDGEFILTAKGYGHGVGMSQYGAQQLALQGKTWQEIIRYYYTGVEIRERS